MNFIHEKIDMGYETLDRTDAPDGRRYVTLEGKNYPSVTTVLSSHITAYAESCIK